MFNEIIKYFENSIIGPKKNQRRFGWALENNHLYKKKRGGGKKNGLLVAKFVYLISLKSEMFNFTFKQL